MFSLAVTVLAFPAFIVAFSLKRAILRWRNRHRKQGRNCSMSKSQTRFIASTFTLGFALQHLQALTHPNVEYVIEQQYDEAADEDDQGEPENTKTQLHRQLKRIRRGERVERLSIPVK